jgi:hypothetical protein
VTVDALQPARTPRRGLIALALLLESAPLLFVGGSDVFGAGTSPETWASGLFWLIAGVLAIGLAGALLRRSTVDPVARLGWWVLTVQLATATLLYYAYWVESTSHTARWSVPLLAALVVPVGVGLFASVQANRRRRGVDPGERADWRAAMTEGRLQAAAAIIGVLGSASVLVVEKVYLPNHDVPTVNIAATVEQLGRTGNDVLLRGTVTITNNGQAPTTVLGSLYSVTGHVFAEPSSSDISGQVEAIDGGNDDVHRFPQRGSSRLLQADDVLRVTDVLMPSETVTRSFTFEGDATSEQFVRLDADVLVMAGRPGADASRRCTQQADRTGNDSAGYSAVCWETRVPVRNTVHRLFDDDLRVQSVVVVQTPGVSPRPLPYLAAIFTAGGTEKIDQVGLWQANFIGQVHTRAEFAYTAADRP